MGWCKMNSDCVCAKCCAALLPYFSVEKLEFSVLNHTFDSSIKDISYDKYFSSSKLSKCATQLCKKDFFLVHFNAQNLPKNKRKIDKFLNNMKKLPNVKAISEIKLHANSVSNVHISNHKLLRTDSNACVGGICLYIKDTIKFRLRNDLLLKLKHYEDLWLELECKGLTLTVAVVCRHPNQDMLSFQDKLGENLNNIENKKLNYIVSGDININTLNKSISKIKKKLHSRIKIYWVQIIDKQSNQVC